MKDKEYLNAKEATVVTGYSMPSIYRMAREKKIPCHKPSGRWLFKLDELREWMNNNFKTEEIEENFKVIQVIPEPGYTVTKIDYPPEICPWVHPGEEAIDKYEYIFVCESSEVYIADDRVHGTFFLPGFLSNNGLVIGAKEIRKPLLHKRAFARYLRGAIVDPVHTSEGIDDLQKVMRFYNVDFGIREVCEEYMNLYMGDITKEEKEALSRYVRSSMIK